MDTEKETDKQIAALKRGDLRAFEKLFRRWKDPVYGYVLRMVGDEALAADLTQEVFLRVMRAAKSYDHRGRLRQWLFTIAANLVTDHGRRLKRRREVRLTSECEFRVAGYGKRTGNSKLETRNSLGEVVQRGVDQLPPEQRSVLLMRQYAGLTFKEIAALEGCSINTALSRMRYALGNLRKILTDKFEVVQKDELRRS